MKKILSDDTELMLFGFRFLEQVLYGENTINLRKDISDKRIDSYLEKDKGLELEAAERRAAMQDDEHTDHDENNFVEIRITSAR